MREGFIGGVRPPLRELFILLSSFFNIGEIFFGSVIKIISGVFFLNFHLSDEGKVVSLAPQVEGGFRVTPNWGWITPLNPELFFQIYWPRQVG